MIEGNLRILRKKISDICKKVNRDSKDIRIIAVTKGVGVDRIKEAISFGITEIGENYIQEAKSKLPALKDYNIRWHFIGHLQSNKVKYAVKIFDLIQSVDSIELLEEINREARKNNKVQDCLVQINTSQDTDRFGIDVKSVLEFFKLSNEFKNIDIKGLMLMAPLLKHMEQTREHFRAVGILRDDINSSFLDGEEKIKILSMGMSWDYAIALEEGSNMLRIGTAIFGARG